MRYLGLLSCDAEMMVDCLVFRRAKFKATVYDLAGRTGCR